MDMRIILMTRVKWTLINKLISLTKSNQVVWATTSEETVQAQTLERELMLKTVWLNKPLVTNQRVGKSILISKKSLCYKSSRSIMSKFQCRHLKMILRCWRVSHHILINLVEERLNKSKTHLRNPIKRLNSLLQND